MSKRTREIGWTAYQSLQAAYRQYGLESLHRIAIDLAWGISLVKRHECDYDEAIAIVQAQIEIIEIEHDLAHQEAG